MAVFAVLTFASCNDEYDDSILTNRVDNLENRVHKLEELCSQINTNIGSLQTLINALQDRDYITNVTPITREEKTIGYTIAFAKSSPITIYHGKDGENGKNGEDGKDGVNGADGKDGENGKDGVDGKDGSTPIIGVQKHTDGIYYWTINDEWLLDDNGNKVKAEGTDGKDGTDGTNGSNGLNGSNGKDGKDGVIPKLKITSGYWYVSYNNGSTWTELGKATGEDGVNGNDGDNMFNNIIVNNDNVTFILKNGMQFSLPTCPITHLGIEVKEAGTLNQIITNEQKNNITSLTINGSLNETDLKVVNLMKNLEKLDLKEAKNVVCINPYGELLPNKTIREIILPSECQNVNFSNMLALETIGVSTDSLHFSYGNSSMLNSIIYSEGVTVIPKKDNILEPFDNVFFPSSMLRISHDALYTSWRYNNVIVTCNAATPPVIGDWEWHRVTDYYGSYSKMSFDEPQNEWENQDFSHIIVKVPSESVELYKQAKCWRKLNIIAME